MKMRLFASLIVCCFAFLSCDCSDINKVTQTNKAIEWVNTHPRPIIVTSISRNGWTMNYRCMFTDANGCIYYAGEIAGFQPDTIK